MLNSISLEATLTTLRLIAIASDPIGGHYKRMCVRRAVTLGTRLDADITDLTRLSRQAGEEVEFHVAPVLDVLDKFHDLSMRPQDVREERGELVAKELARAADYAHACIVKERSAYALEAERALFEAADRLGIDLQD